MAKFHFHFAPAGTPYTGKKAHGTTRKTRTSTRRTITTSTKRRRTTTTVNKSNNKSLTILLRRPWFQDLQLSQRISYGGPGNLGGLAWMCLVHGTRKKLEIRPMKND